MDKEMVWVGEPVQRWSAGRKREAVLRLLRGEPAGAHYKIHVRFYDQVREHGSLD